MPSVQTGSRYPWTLGAGLPCARHHREPLLHLVLEHDDLDGVWEEAHRLMSATNFHGQGPNQCGDNCAWLWAEKPNRVR